MSWQCFRAIIIRTYPDFYPLYAQPDFTWNKIRQQNRNPLLGAMDGADGLKTGYTKRGGLWPGRFGGQQRPTPDCGCHRAARPKNAPTKQRKRSNGVSGISSNARSLPKARRSGPRSFWRRERPRRAEGGWPVKVMLPKSGGGADRSHRLHRAGAGTGDRRYADRKSQGLAQRQLILTMPLKAAENIGKGNMPQRAFDAVTEMRNRTVPCRSRAAMMADATANGR